MALRVSGNTPMGKQLGEQMVRLIEPEIAKLAADGEPDERCKTCALRAGTVPNGCEQTLMDLTKCIFEQEPFYCHQYPGPSGQLTKVCHGWLSAVAYASPRPIKMPWQFTNEREDAARQQSQSQTEGGGS